MRSEDVSRFYITIEATHVLFTPNSAWPLIATTSQNSKKKGYSRPRPELAYGACHPQVANHFQTPLHWVALFWNSRKLNFMAPPTTPTSMSTRAHPARSLTWLLLDTTRNPVGNVYLMTVPGHSLNIPVLELDWAHVLQERFRFTVDEATMSFWKVGHQSRFSPPRCLTQLFSRPLPCSQT